MVTSTGDFRRPTMESKSLVAASAAFFAGVGLAQLYSHIRKQQEAECPGFEGPEKRLEINCRACPDVNKNLRTLLPKAFWEECMKQLNGSILDHKAGDHWDSYIITESSLFVSSTKVIVLTCGTTTLLQCVDFLLAGIRNLGIEVLSPR